MTNSKAQSIREKANEFKRGKGNVVKPLLFAVIIKRKKFYDPLMCRIKINLPAGTAVLGSAGATAAGAC